MNSGLAGFLVIFSLVCLAVGVWLSVVLVQYLRTGTQAHRRYLELNPSQRPAPVSTRRERAPWDQ